MSSLKQKRISGYLVHSCIGLALMAFFRFIPVSLPEVTDTGMEVLSIFIGTLYLWSTVDPTWASILSVAMLGFSSYGAMNAVLVEAFGSPVVVQTMFIMVFSGAMVENKVTLYIARFFLTRKVIEGRPWVFTYVIMVGCFLLAAFVNAFVPIFLFWPVMYGVFEEVGYKKGDLYTRIAVTLVVMGSLIGFPVPPFMANGLALLSNYRNISNHTVYLSDMGYMSMCLIIGFVVMAALVLFCKYVLKPDVEPLKKVSVEMMNKNPLPPLDLNQKILSAGFVFMVLCLLLPSIFPNISFMAFIASCTYGIAMTIVGILSAFRIKNKPIINLPKIMGTQFSWPSYFLIMAAILLGNALTNDKTGIGACLNYYLSPLFTNLSPFAFTIGILLAAVILTNLCNSLVIGMLLQPVILAYCQTTGSNAAPIVSLMICFVLASACVTPAASPFAALLHGNKEWLEKGDAYKYGGMFVLIQTAIIFLLGIPLANLLM